MNERNPEELGTGALIAQLFRESRDWARAEIGFYKTLLRDRLDAAKMAAAFGIAGAVLANAALIALLVGLIIALMPVVGIVWSIVIVIGVTLATAGLLVRAAIRRMQQVTASTKREEM
ncbi:phage holin family protein [Stakelama saccharophila]|uniref:Phage holin family protein n=1 Tax=Stakelama saccharophila TaxID=3075605 RepID=A0ABZ0BC71_9SPHN|nr:phage holin family protein [Stakelama sp. W311]WNO55042.1 phage holin family protein [Stakelama sp. W311]